MQDGKQFVDSASSVGRAIERGESPHYNADLPNSTAVVENEGNTKMRI